MMNKWNVAVGSLVAAVVLGVLYAFGVLAFVLLLALALCGLAVWAPRAAPDEAAAQNAGRRKCTLRLSVALGGLCTLMFGGMTWDYLSWPNRQMFGVLLQVPALMGLIYHYQYTGFVLRRKHLPTKVWPMRTIALVMGGMFGAMFVPIQVQWAEQRFQERQRPLVEALQAAEDKCGTFKRHLTENPPDGWFETPDLYFGAVENIYAGQPQFVLAFRARSNMESMIVYYYSGSRKWVTTMRENELGMKPLVETTRFLARCDGPGNPIVRSRQE